MSDWSAYYPGRTWPFVEPSGATGWSQVAFGEVQTELARLGSTAVMVVVGGQPILAWGDVARPINVRSIRKSLLSALYGIHVVEGRIDLRSTLVELGIDDNEPSLTPVEQQARVADLLKSRSGIYHRSSYQSPADAAALPPRGSHPPGTYWYYNNWDFNALGTIFERCTGTRIFEDFVARIAAPLGMEDFTAQHGEYVCEAHSFHPAYVFRLSARDLARFGLLYLRRGRWGEPQIVSPEWVAESSVPYSLTNDWTVESAHGMGYGYMWWVEVAGRLYPGVSLGDGAIAASGYLGQYLVVAPALDLVVVHLIDVEHPSQGRVSPEQFGHLLRAIVDALSSC